MTNGVVIRYDADRGFGFVRSRAYGSDDIFVHASTVVGGGLLHPGQRVRFSVETSDKGPRATRVEPGRRGLTPRMASALALAVVLIAGTSGLVYSGKLSILWAWLATINVVTFVIYAWDKHRAKVVGARRVPEMVLHGLALVGGTIGAIGAMLIFRHKTRKAMFLIPFIAIVLLQTAALTWWFMRKS